MSLAQLAGVAVVPMALIWDFEAEHGMILTPPDLEAVQDTLEHAGVEFLDGQGVKLRKGGK